MSNEHNDNELTPQPILKTFFNSMMAYNEENRVHTPRSSRRAPHSNGRLIAAQANTMRASGLRPPSRIPATPGLSELSNTETNVRAMPPPTMTLKHKQSACKALGNIQGELPVDRSIVPEPQPLLKRKTLAERAGEPQRPTSTQTPRAVNGSVKASVLASVRPSTSTTTRVPSGSSRNTSASSTISSSTNGSRPPSVASSYRSQTAMGHARSATFDQAAFARSTTSYEDQEDELMVSTTKRKGMPPLSLSASKQQDRLRLKRQRHRGDTTGSCTSGVSCDAASRSQSAFRTSSTEKDPSRENSLTTAFQSLTLRSTSVQIKDNTFPCSEKEFETPQTPSFIPKAVPKTPRPARPPQTLKTPSTRHKPQHASPDKIVYLTRDSNTPAIAWDTKGRLEDMESLYSELKSQFQGAAFEKTGLEESLALYKTRRKIGNEA